MTATLRLNGVRVLDPAHEIDEVRDVLLDGGELKPAGPADTTWDARGLWLMPGIIDLSGRMGEPGPPHPASLGSELRAAAASGIATVCMPPDCEPVIDNANVIEWIERRAAAANGARLRLIGALTQGLDGSSLSNMARLRDAGCVALSMGLRALPRTDVLRQALIYARGCDLPVILRAEDAALAGDGIAHEGAIATKLGLVERPAVAETAGLATLIALVEDTGCRLHIARLSSARSLPLLEAARNAGLPITADVSAMHLALDCTAVDGYDTRNRLQPPLRDASDRQALRAAVVNGLIDAVCSDHTPLPGDAKNQPFADADAGAAGFDTLVPLTLDLVHSDGLTPLQWAARLHSAPLAVVGDSHTAPPRSFSLIDPECNWTLDTDTCASACTNTGFWQVSLRGRGVASIIDGRVHTARHWQPGLRV